MISEEFAEVVFGKIVDTKEATLDSTELEQLQVMLCSETGIKALARIYFYVTGNRDLLVSMPMGTPEGLANACVLQGKIQGAGEVITGLLALITTPSEEDKE